MCLKKGYAFIISESKTGSLKLNSSFVCVCVSVYHYDSEEIWGVGEQTH